MTSTRDDFPSRVKDVLARRASFICSNPECRVLTLAPSTIDSEKVIYIGVAAHIAAAAEGGARYDSSMSPEIRASVENAIFLCTNCSTMIDKNLGTDFPSPLLHQWKSTHEQWVTANLNKRIDATQALDVSIGSTTIHNGSFIISHNQIGGQIAHEITNVGTQPRRVSKEAINLLVNKLKVYPPEEVDFLVANDPESHKLKEIIKNAMLASNWTVKSDVIDLVSTATGIDIAILDADKEKESFLILLNWIHQSGLAYTGNAYTSGLSRTRIYIASNPV